LVTATAAALALSGCGSLASPQRGDGQRQSAPSISFHAHPQVVEPVAGASGALDSASAGGVSVNTAGTSGALAEPVSLQTVRQELGQSGMSANQDSAELTAGGLAIAPVSAPQQVQEIIDAGNEIAHLPYVWGGGHEKFIDTGYDCSGSLSFVLAAAGLLNTTMTSGQLATWGKPGPGKWVTIFANAGHTFMYVAGLRFDTVALAETGTRWSNRSADESNLSSFAVRHPPGL
jgi:cell wall-associated NlpC family hydrolase